MFHLKLIAVGLCLLALGACNSLPAAGPTARQLEGSVEPNFDVYLVSLSAPIVQVLSRYQEEGFPNNFRLESHKPTIVMQPGDSVNVSIYETGGTPLFGGAAPKTGAAPSGDSSAQASTLPTQIIEQDGQILIPFVGRVSVAGKTPSRAADEIAGRLAQQAVKPQVIVTVVNNNTNALTVGGEVNKAGLIPLTLRGEKLLDVIAQAGGPRLPATQLDIRVIRGTTTATIPLQNVLQNPADNIAVRPNDSIVLVKNPKTFVVMGAATKVAQYEMQTERVTLAEGIAQAGGTIDSVGNLAAIYLLRSEPTSLARAVMAADTSAVDTSYVRREEARQLSAARTRVMYRVDLTKAGGYFYAQNLMLRDKDIVLVANAEATQLQKLFTLLRGITGIYFDVSKAGSVVVAQ
jgi:polysaccharide export outer membrane protein